MNKRILALLLSFVLCFSLFGCDNRTATPKESPATATPTNTPEKGATPLLYKVTDESGNTIWLFGSIHVGKEEFFPLPDYVMDAFASSEALAVEADIVAFEKDLKGQVAALRNLIYADGTKIKDHVSEETYNSAVEILEENNLYNGLLDTYMPSFWASYIEICTYMKADIDVSLGVDRYFINLANKAEKEILEVESAAFQYGVLGGFSEELQIFLLENAISSYQNLLFTKASLNRLLNLWNAGDEKVFSSYFAEEAALSAAQTPLYEEYQNAMIVSRNDSMTQYAEDALKSGKEIFICVGAAHVVGEGAMAQQLRQLGYTVEIVK